MYGFHVAMWVKNPSNVTTCGCPRRDVVHLTQVMSRRASSTSQREDLQLVFLLIFLLFSLAILKNHL